MTKIPIYRAEVDAGVAEAIRTSGSLAISGVVREGDGLKVAPEQMARLRSIASHFATAAETDFDLHHINTVLVTTGWNKNDDVFDGFEMWAARRTPEDKQLNYEHDDAKIVGHIISNCAVKADGEKFDGIIPEDTTIDDLPPKFHLITGAVLYKHWQTPELQERMDTILSEIAKGALHISMECLFKGFDYALKDSSGGSRVVARNDKTAFLSKHLRAYGGTGSYDGYRVGRLLRNIVFSGKGLVKDPANPESIILKETETFSSSHATYATEFLRASEKQVYEPATNKTQSENLIMTVTIEQVQAELAASKAEVATLKGSQAETKLNELKSQLDAAVANKTEADLLLLKEAEAHKVASGEVLKATKRAEAAEAKLVEAQDELKTLYADKTTALRVAASKDKLKFTDEQATKYVATQAKLTDEEFASGLDVMALAMTAWVTNNPQSGNTTFPAPAVKEAPKATSVPVGPKSTNKAAPMAGKAGVETDVAGEGAAATTDLEGAEAAAAVALATNVPADAAVKNIQMSIAKAFGYEETAG